MTFLYHLDMPGMFYGFIELWFVVSYRSEIDCRNGMVYEYIFNK